jgi:hypothetical protein
MRGTIIINATMPACRIFFMTYASKNHHIFLHFHHTFTFEETIPLLPELITQLCTHHIGDHQMLSTLGSSPV